MKILKWAFHKSPYFVKNFSFSLFGFYNKYRRYNSNFKSELDRLKKSQWYSESQINQYQRSKLIHLVKDILPNVNFYNSMVGNIKNPDECTVEQILNFFPIIDKNIVKLKIDDFVNSSLNASSLSKVLTSGTSGIPLTIYHTKNSMSAQWAIWWRHRDRFGLQYKDRQLMIGAKVPIRTNTTKPPFWLEDKGLNRTYLSAYHINKKNIYYIAEYLKKNKFTYVSGYPSAIASLAELLLDSSISLTWKPKVIVTGSDKLGNYEKGIISKAFRCDVTDQYGMAEFCGNISSCEEGHYHLDFECGIVEEVSLDNGWVKLIFTGLLNEAMPLVRYDVGDTALALNHACKCGRKSKAYKYIGGRSGEYIFLPDGTKIIGLNQVFEYGKNFKDIQLKQTSLKKLDLYFVPENDFIIEEQSKLINELKDRLSNDVVLKIHIVESIERPPNEKKSSVKCLIE